jgi:hypothetical protein
MEGADNVGVTPVGVIPDHEPDSVTGELKPFCEATVHMLWPLPPCIRVTDDGADGTQTKLKPGVPAPEVVNKIDKPGGENPTSLDALIVYE